MGSARQSDSVRRKASTRTRGGDETRLARAPQQSLQRHIERFPQAGVLVVGDLILDHYIWGKVSRISPEAPVPVVLVESESLQLGERPMSTIISIPSGGGRTSAGSWARMGAGSGCWKRLGGGG